MLTLYYFPIVIPNLAQTKNGYVDYIITVKKQGYEVQFGLLKRLRIEFFLAELRKFSLVESKTRYQVVLRWSKDTLDTEQFIE